MSQKQRPLIKIKSQPSNGFLTLDRFLSHFPLIDISKSEFVDRFTVMYATPQSLRDIFALVPVKNGKAIIKKPESDKRYINRERIIDYFYEIVITNRHKYLKCFYEAYFEFKDPETLKWSKIDIYNPTRIESENIDGIISLQKNDASRRLVRNLFYLELLHYTKVTNTVKSHVSFWQALDNMYNGLKLEDRMFAPSSIDLFLKEKGKGAEINYNNLFYLFQAYQPKASIFNPYSIKWILDNIINQTGALFTPVLSWGSYLAAFMHSNYTEYVGVDVMPSVCDKVKFLAEWYKSKGGKFNKRTEIYCCPSESLLDDETFLNTYSGHFNAILVCPPYYDMEIYHEGQQSLKLYPDYKSWLANYWMKTVELCYRVTKSGGVFALIANDYKTLDGDYYPLVDDLDKIVREKYGFKNKYYLQNRTSPLRVNAKARTERLLVYQK